MCIMLTILIFNAGHRIKFLRATVATYYVFRISHFIQLLCHDREKGAGSIHLPYDARKENVARYNCFRDLKLHCTDRVAQVSYRDRIRLEWKS